MTTPIQLITLDDAAAICAEHGLVDLNRKFWANQTDRGQVQCTVLGGKKRLRRDYVTSMIDRAIREATAPQRAVDNWARATARRATTKLSRKDA
ncbi:MAG: hypothetical protein ABS76_26490 [Pelagibacterium sp. SCN 64-44]|nr:MAG: hypothetical protein ABS76_26490 [Pelagibacterium sp. SCN 64-44]